MNLIESQAKEFYTYEFKTHEGYQEFIKKLRWQLDEYHKASHKFEFLDKIRSTLRQNYDKHLEVCRFPNDREKCDKNMLYENCLFFTQGEIEKLQEEFGDEDISIASRKSISEQLERILSELNTLKMGQQVTYEGLAEEMEDLKDHFYLSKKSWTQLFLGKITDMTASGLVNETLSKELLRIATDGL